MNTDAIASISHDVPSAGPAAVERPTKRIPAIDAKSDMFTIVRKYVFLTFTPERAAAALLPPTAYT